MAKDRIDGTSRTSQYDYAEYEKEIARTSTKQAAATKPTNVAAANAMPRLRIAPITIDEVAKIAIDALTALEVPVALIDTSLYTDDALEREITNAETRLASRTDKNAQGERELLTKLEAEYIRRTAPPKINPRDLKTKEEVDAMVAREKKFLERFSGKLAPDVKRAHEQRLIALQSQREWLHEINQRVRRRAAYASDGLVDPRRDARGLDSRQRGCSHQEKCPANVRRRASAPKRVRIVAQPNLSANRIRPDHSRKRNVRRSQADARGRQRRDRDADGDARRNAVERARRACVFRLGTAW